MACGCLCVGFTGFGGWDYMRQIEMHGYAPHGYALRDVLWTGNGWWSADGDVLGAALGLERAMAVKRTGGLVLSAIGQNAQRTVAAYGQADQLGELVKL
jgi:hypothetical protein